MYANGSSAETLLSKFEDTREIKNVMGIFSGLYLIKREKDIYSQLWSARDDVCLGINEGFYSSAQKVAAYYEALGVERDYKSAFLAMSFPAASASLNADEATGFGLIDYRPVDTFVIEVADDRKTAKGIWYCRGSYVDVTEKGPLSRWLWGYYAVDFIIENDKWKIWHLLDLKDADNFCGTRWADTSIDLPILEAFLGADNFVMPEPDIPRPLRERYHSHRKWSPAPRLPEPYNSFDETFSYGLDYMEETK